MNGLVLRDKDLVLSKFGGISQIYISASSTEINAAGELVFFSRLNNVKVKVTVTDSLQVSKKLGPFINRLF